MSTRSLTLVTRNSATKVAQFGSHDGYVSNQGAIVLNFLSNICGKKCRAGQRVSPLTKFCLRIDQMRWATEAELSELDNDSKANAEFDKNHPAGADILNAIQYGKYMSYEGPVNVKPVKCLINSEEFAQDTLFCEYVYIINLDKQTFEIKAAVGFEGHSTLAIYSFKNLPSKDLMIKECKEAQELAYNN